MEWLTQKIFCFFNFQIFHNLEKLSLKKEKCINKTKEKRLEGNILTAKILTVLYIVFTVPTVDGRIIGDINVTLKNLHHRCNCLK